MDISETYIKMSDCEEIQGNRYYPLFMKSGVHIQDGEWFVGKDVGSTEFHWLWLPRQDQLQEMLDNRFSNRYNCVLADKFGRYCISASGRFDLSMEQLWLAFVMKEKYNKVWSGTEWLVQRNRQ